MLDVEVSVFARAIFQSFQGKQFDCSIVSMIDFSSFKLNNIVFHRCIQCVVCAGIIYAKKSSESQRVKSKFLLNSCEGSV